jgi:hypothetical protein
VEQAIGYIEAIQNRQLKVCLAERLVVDAVLEYRQLAHQDRSIIDENLGLWQYQHSSFGFITEDRLAEAVYVYAHQNQYSTKRAQFLRNFDNVYHIFPQVRHSPPIKLGLENYVLEHDPASGAKALDGNENVGPWLHQLLNGTPRPTFLLPSKYAGPDVMFVLRDTSSTSVKRLICAI